MKDHRREGRRCGSSVPDAGQSSALPGLPCGSGRVMKPPERASPWLRGPNHTEGYSGTFACLPSLRFHVPLDLYDDLIEYYRPFY